MALFKVIQIANAKRIHEKPPIPATLWQNPLQFIAFGFGTGAIPVAPGTFGTLLAIPFYLLCRSLPSFWYIFLVVILTLVSIVICDRVSREINVHDHPGVNLDEVVGYFVTMCFAPHHWSWVVIGFLLFRLFDIWKPWPIRFLDEHVSGGFGIVIDDVLAGIYSCVILQALVMMTSRW
jgi:phosphatidylglycerophosphatase A